MFFENENEKAYRLYSEKMTEKSKATTLQEEPKLATTEIPAMFINVDSFEELHYILEEVKGEYSIIFDNDARKYLTENINKESIIDMSMKNFTFDELMIKVAEKYDIYFSRENNVYTFKLYTDKKFKIPSNLIFENREVLKNSENSSGLIIENLKLFTKNPNKDSFIYDNLSGILYVKDRVSVVKNMENYLNELKKLEDILFTNDIYVIEYESKRKEINWEVLNNNIQDLNIALQSKENSDINFLGSDKKEKRDKKYLFENGDIVKDKIVEYLEESGSAKVVDKIILNTYNNKTTNYTINENKNIVNKKDEKDYVIEELNSASLNIAVTPSYLRESNRINLNVSVSNKTLQKIQLLKTGPSEAVKKPAFIEKKIENMYTIPQNSYVLLSINKHSTGGLQTTISKNLFESFFSSDYTKETLLLIKVKSRVNNSYIN